MSDWGDNRQAALAQFQVGVDNVIFSVDSSHNRLLVLLVKRVDPPQKGAWGLPGTFVRAGESLEDSAYRVLSEKIEVKNLYLEQLYSFGDRILETSSQALGHGNRQRYLSVSYFALVRYEDVTLMGQEQDLAAWFPVDLQENMAVTLAFNHLEILQYGHMRLQNKVTYSPVAFDVLPSQFTLNDLYQFYCTILGTEFADYSNFRSRLLKLGFLLDTGQKVSRGAGRPAALYEFDPRAFLPFQDKPLVFV
ncbi:MAG: NUDIX hydrolase [Acaryochloridaceae cyanobacterium RL_2_7]|nr:NUDIX hydrolase [Acaryochloridaceae cyanobacterium RL_2_7]